MIRVSHLSLGISDLDQSEKFYRDVLGLNVERDGDDLAVRWPDFLLTLRLNPPADRAKFHYGFQVPSRAEVDEWGKRLRERGAQMVSGPSDHNGTYQLFFLDPDAYEIEIFAD